MDTSEPLTGKAKPFGTYAPTTVVRVMIMLAQATPLGRGGARRYITRLLRRWHEGPIDVHLFGQRARLLLHGNSSETKALIKPQLYARAARRTVADVLPKQGGVLIDIGANAGLFSLMATAHMDTGTVIAAEPQPALIERLRTNLIGLKSDNQRGLNVYLFDCAVGAEAGESILHIPRQLGQASLHPLAAASPLTVPIQPLVQLIDEAAVDHVDLLKIDIEGYEDDVLFPFFETAPETLWPTAIVLEHCHSDRWRRNCLTLLSERGYQTIAKSRTDTVFVKLPGT
ncbi:MAG: FkbM family methyltransferase [Pseudomonadota bacterium]